MLVLYCFCVATEFSVNKDLYNTMEALRGGGKGPCPSELGPQQVPEEAMWRLYNTRQEAQLSPSDRAMRLVSSNLANYHETVQKLLIRQVLTKPMV